MAFSYIYLGAEISTKTDLIPEVTRQVRKVNKVNGFLR